MSRSDYTTEENMDGKYFIVKLKPQEYLDSAKICGLFGPINSEKENTYV